MAVAAVMSFTTGIKADPGMCLPSLNTKTRPRGWFNTSLPVLPHYELPAPERKRWGEDDAIERFERLEQFRNNFNGCHPVPDVFQPSTYESYMQFKKTHPSISILNRRTTRYSPRDPYFELFPRHDPNRTNHDGSYVLGDSTRQALRDYTKYLYITSRYDQVYEDNSEFMKREMDRDAQFNKDIAEFEEEPICECHGLYHADPCPRCWASGFNTDLENPGEIPDVCGRCNSNLCANKKRPIKPITICANKKHPIRPILKQIASAADKNVLGDACHNSLQGNCICRGKHDSKCSTQCDLQPHAVSSAEIVCIPEEKAVCCVSSTPLEPDPFGPWTDNIQVSNKDEPYVYQFKLPRTTKKVHWLETENMYPSPFQERDAHCSSYDVNDHNFRPSVAQISANMDLAVVKQTTREQSASVSYQCGTATVPCDHNLSNSWTFRDKDNRRIPCMSQAIGSTHKHDAYKRYYREHPEPIPDRRNYKGQKRYVFFGYHSSVCR